MFKETIEKISKEAEKKILAKFLEKYIERNIKDNKEIIEYFKKKENKKLIENEVLNPIVEEIFQLECYDSEKVREILDKKLTELEKEGKFPSEILQAIRNISIKEEKEKIVEEGREIEETKVKLDEEFEKKIKEFFRKEGKGENFREKADPEFLKGYLYLMTEGELKNKFKADFERLISAKEEKFFLGFLPYFFKKEFELGEFSKELQSRIEDLSKGKSRITLEFTEKELPEEIKKELEDKNDEEKKKFLESLGIHQEGRKYEIYITKDKLADIIQQYTETLVNSALTEARVEKQIKDIKEKLKDAKEVLGKDYYNALNIQFSAMLMSIEDLKRRGATEEEWKKIEEQLNNFSKNLEGISSEKDKKKAESKARKFLKEIGGWTLQTAGIFGLLLFWFLPLWMISRMQKDIENILKK